MIGLALSFLALAASAAATGYIDGQEYVYRYKGYIYSGYPRIKPQESGYAYDVQLRIQPEGDHAVFKIDNANRASFNGEYEDITKAHLEYKDLPAHAESLSKPFRVHRKNGIVTHFEVTRDEPSFSVNLKRGIASLFSLNLEQVDPSTEDNTIKTDPDAHYYKVNEDTLLGECETAYVIEHHPYDQTHNIVLNVTKVRNFHNCKNRPSQVYSVFLGNECGEAEHEKSHTLHGNAQYHYSIRGDRHHYVIEKIRTESDFAYTPYPIEGQTVSTMIKRSLDLVEEKPVSEPLTMAGDLVDLTSLIYEFDYQKDFKEPVDLKMPHYLYHVTGRKAPMSDIRNQFEELLHVYNDETYAERIRDKEFPAKFVELLRSVGTVGYDEIKELYTAYADIPKQGASEQQKLSRNLFMDVLVNLGTNPAFFFGKHLVEEKKVNAEEAVYFINYFPFHVKEVSETLLDNLQELCDHDNVKRKQHLHVTCVMTLSTVVFDHCVAKYHPEGIREGKNVCPYDSAVKYFNYIARLYEQTKSEKMKSQYLKAAGTIGVKELIPYVLPYAHGHGHILHRNIALWSLRRIGLRWPEKTRPVLVPILFNRTENFKTRISAFSNLLQSSPKLYELEGLARALKYDPDDQLRSFVYSTFKHMANSTNFCDRKIAKDAHYALRILEDVHHEFERYDRTYSFSTYFSGFDQDYDFGGSNFLAYVSSDTGYLPFMLFLDFDNYIGGKSTISLALHAKQVGLEKFFDRLFGPEGSFGRQSLFDLFKKRGKRDAAGVQNELNEIKEKLHLPVHEYEPFKAEVIVNYLGHFIYSQQFDEETFEQFFKDGRFTIPNIPAAYQKIPAFKYQRFMLNVDKFYVMPSESGIPFFFDYKQPFYYFHQNKESSFKVEPGFFPEDRGGQFPDHVRAETDGHFAFDQQLVASMGAVIPFDQVTFGGGINKRCTLSLPLKVKLDLIVNEKKLKTHWEPVAPHEIYHFKYEPFTFIDSYANTVPQVLEKEYLPVKNVHRHENEKHFFHDALGVGFDVRTDYQNEFNDFGSWVDFFLKKDFRQKVLYLFSNPNFEPYDVSVKFTNAEHDVTREVEMDMKYYFHDNNWIISHFAEENFEDFDSMKGNRGPLSTSGIKANIVAKGDRERKIHAYASLTQDLFREFHKINFFYERNPFTPSETEDFKVCGSSYLLYEDLDRRKMSTQDTVGMDIQANTGLKVNFGKSCNADQKFKIHGVISRSEESLEFERRREEPDTPEHYNEYSYHYHECQKERETEHNYGDHCFAYMDLVKTLHKYDFHIKHENLSPRFLNMTYLLDRILKFRYYTHSDHNEIGVHNPENEVHIEANFSSKLPVADVRVHKPLSNSNYYNVYVPQYVGFYSSPADLFEDVHIKNSIDHHYCNIHGNLVHTFDNYEYTLPEIDCWKVVAKDCSDKEYFTYLEKKIDHPKFKKALKIYLGPHKIEVTPAAGGLDIIVDGKQVTVSKHEPFIFKEGEEVDPVFYIAYREVYYTLHSEKYGVIFLYDEHATGVKVSPYYRNKLCGLCGNYNGQKFDGPSTENGCYYANEKDYAYSYSIPSDTCSVPKPELICPADGGVGNRWFGTGKNEPRH